MNLRVVSAFALLALMTAFSFSQETVEKQPKIVLLFDVSASMNTIDGPVPPGRDPATLPTRQEQVVQFLTGERKAGDPFLDQLLKKASVSAYRFGAGIDDVAHFEPGQTWSADEWRRWLKSDRRGSNVAGSALQMLQQEKDSYLQAIVVFSDGRSNRTTAGEIEDFLAEVRDAKRPISVFTVGVGSHEALPSIRLRRPYAPDNVRPGDTFPVNIAVEGDGIAGEEFQVLLEAQRVKTGDGKPVPRQKRFLPVQTGNFKASGPTIVEFEIDLDKLAKPGDQEGIWQFTARVPSRPREAVGVAEHVSEPLAITVQNKRTRVLLFAHSATREYIFLRTLLFREAQEKRVDLSVYLQSAKDADIDQQVGADKVLKRFPDTLDGKPGDPYSLRSYDVVVTFDPDWIAVDLRERKFLEKWVADHAGGIIFTAGMVNSYQIARPGGNDMSALQKLMPVVLKDSRLHGLGVPGMDTTRPYALNFTNWAKQYPFLKLDDASENPTAGWNTFFWNNEKFKPDAGKDQKPRRGFFSCYPVERLKPNSEVVATFAGPKDMRIGDRTDAFKDQQPFIVVMRHGSGRTAYLGSGEFWRLRAVQEAYYERFWLGLIRYVSNADPKQPGRFGRILLPRTATVGDIPIEVQMLDKDDKPLAAEKLVKVFVQMVGDKTVPKPIDLKADAKKPGWFAGTLQIKKPGDYIVRVPVPNTKDEISNQLTVREADLELDDVRIDFGQLYELASEADPPLKKLPADKRDVVERILRASAIPQAPPEKERLFLHLNAADTIPALLEKLPAKKFPKVEPAAQDDPAKSIFKDKKTLKVLIIDGEGAKGRKDPGDSYYIERVISSIPGGLYKPTFGDMLADGDSAKALEHPDLPKFGAVLLLNVAKLSELQVANLEKFSKAGGGVGFFLGPKVQSKFYNQMLYNDGKGVFPVPLDATFYPWAGEKELNVPNTPLLLRDDLFPERALYPIFGEIGGEDGRMGEVFSHLPVHRYFRVPRTKWRPQAGRSFELATLPNLRPSTNYGEHVVAITNDPAVKKIFANKKYADIAPVWKRHSDQLQNVVRPNVDAKKAFHLADAIDEVLLDNRLKDFWRSEDPDVRTVLEQFVKLRHDARYGDPFIVGGTFGKGRVIAVMSTAGREWNDFGGGSLASVLYAPFIWETLNHLTRQDRDVPVPPKAKARPPQPPQFFNVAPAYEPTRGYTGRPPIPSLAPAMLVTPDAVIPFHGVLYHEVGLSQAHWVVEVLPIAAVNPKGEKPAPPPVRIPLVSFYYRQGRNALNALTRNVLAGKKDEPYPTGFSKAHDLADEPRFDFRRHLPSLKAKQTADHVQEYYLVKLWIEATSAGKQVARSEPWLFLVGSENELLMRSSRALEIASERLEQSLESVRHAEEILENQLPKLRQPDVDLEVLLVRVNEIRSKLAFAGNNAYEAEQTLSRVLTEADINRVRNSTYVDNVRKIASKLDTAVAQRETADDAVGTLTGMLEAGKKDGLAAQARLAQKSLMGLKRHLAATQDQMSEGLIEGKLIAILRAIEREQLERKRKGGSLDREIEALIKGLTEKKK